MNNNFTESFIRAQLNKGLVTVSFIKKNGEQRVMTCTTNAQLIPQAQQPKQLEEGATPRNRSTNTISAWDVNAQGWRSFIWQNVTDIHTEESFEDAKS